MIVIDNIKKGITTYYVTCEEDKQLLLKIDSTIPEENIELITDVELEVLSKLESNKVVEKVMTLTYPKIQELPIIHKEKKTYRRSSKNHYI